MNRYLIGLAASLAFLALGAGALRAQDDDLKDSDVAEVGHPVGEAHSSGHGHVGAAGVSNDPSELKTDLAIYSFVVFLLLLAILQKFAWGPISTGLEKREHRIAEHIAAAERSHQDAKAMLAEYERKLAAAQDEVRAILDEARRDAEHTHQEILAKAKAEAAAEAARARHDVETARDQALKQLVETSANLAVDLAGQILKAKLSPADHSKLISEAVAKFHPQHASQN
jgi:F-type H+-transporting ATPase subunit b